MMIVKTYHGDYELNDKVAQIVGIKLGEHEYKSLTEGQNTIFTAPPQFDISYWALDYLLDFAKKGGIEIKNKNSSREVCEELVKYHSQQNES